MLTKLTTFATSFTHVHMKPSSKTFKLSSLHQKTPRKNSKAMKAQIGKRQPSIKTTTRWWQCHTINDSTNVSGDAVADAVQRILKAFASAETPILFFLDHLQYAEQESIELIRGRLCSKYQSKRILFIFSFQNQQFHLQSFLHPQLRSDYIPITHLPLDNRNVDAVDEMLLSLLNIDTTDSSGNGRINSNHDDGDRSSLSVETTTTKTRRLAEIVWNKTGGLPIFIVDYLHFLHREGFLVPQKINTKRTASHNSSRNHCCCTQRRRSSTSGTKNSYNAKPTFACPLMRPS